MITSDPPPSRASEVASSKAWRPVSEKSVGNRTLRAIMARPPGKRFQRQERPLLIFRDVISTCNCRGELAAKHRVAVVGRIAAATYNCAWVRPILPSFCIDHEYRLRI